jgi:serine/threonine protein kinase
MYQESIDVSVLELSSDPSTEVNDFRSYLGALNIPYKHKGYYLQVGDIQGIQGWLLHVSIIRSQIYALFNTLLPVIWASGSPFKIPEDLETTINISDGKLGTHLLGKVITLYPDTPQTALHLAQLLISLTRPFDGPEVLTDAHLGGNVYTRYGCFNPIVKISNEGKEVNYLYDKDYKEVPDRYPIPFCMPDGPPWPFDPIATFTANPPKKIYSNFYKPISILKADVKGDVLKALYISQFFRIGLCVLKEAKMNMWSDESGRDMSTRLKWQKELYEKFAPYLALPKVFDLFTEDGNTYLAMKFIKGPSLFNRIMDLNKNALLWTDLENRSRHRILQYIQQMLNILEVYHDHQYVHRDLTPANFLVGKHDKLVPIDLELSYSIHDRTPHPPFESGTRGYMSPQQETLETPACEDDLYALGVTIFNLFTGLYPLSLDHTHNDQLKRSLRFFIGDDEVSSIIYRCLAIEPSKRSTLREIRQTISKYATRLDKKRPEPSPNPSVDLLLLKKFTESALKGLCNAPTVMKDNIWYSASQTGHPTNNPQIQVYEKSVGLAEGVSGVLYVLSKAKARYLDTNPCQSMYTSGWKYIFDQHHSEVLHLKPGLYGGGAGMALALSTALRAGLIEDNGQHRALIAQWLDTEPVSPTLAFGAACQGIALLQCREYLNEDTFNSKLSGILRHLLDNQSEPAQWIIIRHNKTDIHSLHFGIGNLGILWFLLEYSRIFPNPTVQHTALRSLRALLGDIKTLKKQVKEIGVRSLFVNETFGGDAYNGIILTFLKAFESTNDPEYLHQAETMLSVYPEHVVHDNFTQDAGLAALGELYLEAMRITQDPRWQKRADWVVHVLMESAHQGAKDSRFWLNSNQLRPTADFAGGSSGIVHFLIRYAHSQEIGYRMLTK